MDIDVLLEHVNELEQSTAKTISANWRNNWLPFYGENPLSVEVNSKKKARSRRKEYDDIGDDCHAFMEIQLWEQRLRKAESLCQQMALIPREEMLDRLRNLRNFCDSERKLSSFELKLLEPGRFMLYTVKPDFLNIHFGIDDVEKGPGDTICFVKDEKGITMHLPFQSSFEPVTLSQKNWIYRKGCFIAFSLNLSCVYTLKFYSPKNAMKFEFYFLCLTAFAEGTQVINLQGDFPEQQLMAKNSDKTEHALRLHLFVLKDIQERHSKNDPQNFDLVTEDFMKEIRNYAADYLKHVYDLQTVVFMESLSLSASKKILDLGQEIMSDLCTLRQILNFCVLPRNAPKFPSGQTIGDLTKILVEINDNLLSCVKLHDTNGLYHEYFATFRKIYESVEDIVNQPDTHILEEMRLYLKTCEDSSITPTEFINLDEILRIGNEAKFDVFFRNLCNEFAKILFKMTTIESISKNFFCERNDDFSFREDPILKNLENEIKISDLTEKSKRNPLTNTNRLSAAENIVNEKIRHCVANLRDFTKAIEESFKFDIKEWLKLVTMWKSFDPYWQEVEDQRNEIQEKSPNSSISSSSMEGSFEKVDHEDVSPPLSWQIFKGYKEADFEIIKTLSEGSYGSASVEQHKDGWTAVLKMYHSGTDLYEKKKEIDMLIRLQNENEGVVKLHGFFYNEGNTHWIPNGILLEYIERNLRSFIHDRNNIIFKKLYTFKTAIKQMRDMASAFATMHSQGIMHRDINPKNILITNGDKIKICDFGMCGFIDKTIKTVHVGTNLYNSPENLNYSSEYSEKADVFSLGITMWEQVHRRFPYWYMGSNSEKISFVLEGKRLDFNEVCPMELRSIIQRAWAHDPIDRPTMKELRDLLDNALKTIPSNNLQEEVLGLYEKRIVNRQVIYTKRDT